MAEIPVSALDSRQQRLADNIQAALDRGEYGYALAACAEILRTAPDCLPVRRFQRTAQLQQLKARKTFGASLLSGLRSLWCKIGAGRRTASETFQAAERALSADPKNARALKRLAVAAQELALLQTAVFARETLRELKPKDYENWLMLGDLLLALERFAEALSVAEAVLAERPADSGALELMRRASVAQTVARGQWDVPGSFRDKLKL